MTWVLVLSLATVGLFLSGLFSGAETGLYCANRVRLQLGAQQRDPTSLRLSRLLADPPAALGLTLVGTNVANYVTTTAVAFMFAELIALDETATELYTVALVTPIVFVLGEVVPKSLFQRHPNQWLARSSLILAGAFRILRGIGVLWSVNQLTNLAVHIAGADRVRHAPFEPKRRVALLLQEALMAQEAGDAQSHLVERVVQLSETPVHTVMVPRNRVTTIAGDAGRKELVRLARKTDHAQVPVHDPTRRDRMVGIAVIDELLADSAWQSVAQRSHPLVTISPHDTVAAAIRAMQESRSHTLVVTGRGGNLIGVVTLRDLLELLLGEGQTGQTTPASR